METRLEQTMYKQLDINSPDVLMLMKIGVLCNNTTTNDTNEVIGQPTEVALTNLARLYNLPDYRRVFFFFFFRFIILI